jgi:hypothetical protein
MRVPSTEKSEIGLEYAKPNLLIVNIGIATIASIIINF